MKEVINICLISNGHVYAINTGILIVSILMNSDQDDKFYFHIITNDMSDEDKNKLIQLKEIKDFNIKFYTPDLNVLEKYKEFVNKTKIPFYWGYSPFLRLEIMNILKDVDKVISMDVDLVVLKNLKELFYADISNYDILSIKYEKDRSKSLRFEEFNFLYGEKEKKKEKIENDDFYNKMLKMGIVNKNPEDLIFVGVMYMNLKSLRNIISHEKVCKYFNKLIDSKIYGAGEGYFFDYFIPKERILMLDEKYQTDMAIWRKEEYCDDVYIAHYSCGKVFEPSCYFIPKEKNSLLLKGWKYLIMTPWFKEDPIYFMNIFNQYDNIRLERKINKIVDIIVWLIPLKTVRDKIRKMFLY
ncbi:glycosyltransferase [Brachyspira alvinipulli]|uniref:glycosyltransferase n=1 Tax=Brachyspira alvinipulli TaxID=84379 RepID=UPI0004B90998|nr:glycosyltransferase [Brachyspira alvinipulli]